MTASMEMDEHTLLELPDIEMSYGGAAAPEGRGVLTITSKRLMWKETAAAVDEAAEGEAGSGRQSSSSAYEVEIPCITLHAISKDPSSFPKPCLYCQISEGDEDEEEDEGKEIYFVPQDPECLATLFEAMSRAALLNPDPEEPGTNEGDDELIFDQQALEGMGEEQARVLEHLESLMTFTPNLAAVAGGQFDDADDATGAVVEGQNGHHVEGDEGREEEAQ